MEEATQNNVIDNDDNSTVDSKFLSDPRPGCDIPIVSHLFSEKL